MTIFTQKYEQVLRSVNWVTLAAVGPKKDSPDTYLVKSVFEKDRYIVLITNLRYIWFETLAGHEVENRFRALEAGLEYNTLDELLRLVATFLKVEPNITYAVTRTNETLNLTAMRKYLWTEYKWTFQCHLIQNTSILHDGDEEYDLDGASILYRHFILPQNLLVTAFSEQIKTLHGAIEVKEADLKESTQLLDFFKAQHNGGKAEKKKKKALEFDPETTYREIEERLQKYNDEDQAALSIVNDSQISVLFKTATEVVIDAHKRVAELERQKSAPFASVASSVEYDSTNLQSTSQNKDTEAATGAPLSFTPTQTSEYISASDPTSQIKTAKPKETQADTKAREEERRKELEGRQRSETKKKKKRIL